VIWDEGRGSRREGSDVVWHCVGRKMTHAGRYIVLDDCHDLLPVCWYQLLWSFSLLVSFVLLHIGWSLVGIRSRLVGFLMDV
jgi:hypothetical protein